jgi:hypothetical protein
MMMTGKGEPAPIKRLQLNQELRDQFEAVQIVILP